MESSLGTIHMEEFHEKSNLLEICEKHITQVFFKLEIKKYFNTLANFYEFCSSSGIMKFDHICPIPKRFCGGNHHQNLERIVAHS